MRPLKRQKISRHGDNDHSSSEESWSDSSSDHNSDTIDQLVDVTRQKSHQTSKRKIRATGSSTFGAALQSLLHTDTPSELPLSLKPSIARQRNDEKLELRARKVLQVEKKEKEDKGRIRDVIGGWGGESERTLRKVAQRGGSSCDCVVWMLTEGNFNGTVVKLFNAIQSSQTAASISAEDAKAARGTGKPTLSAPTTDSMTRKKDKNKDATGVARSSEGLCYFFSFLSISLIPWRWTGKIGRNDFFDMIRSGAVVSNL
jgi:Rrp15p